MELKRYKSTLSESKIFGQPCKKMTCIFFMFSIDISIVLCKPRNQISKETNVIEPKSEKKTVF